MMNCKKVNLGKMVYFLFYNKLAFSNKILTEQFDKKMKINSNFDFLDCFEEYPNIRFTNPNPTTQ
jgi:hypothetical protein